MGVHLQGRDMRRIVFLVLCAMLMACSEAPTQPQAETPPMVEVHNLSELLRDLEHATQERDRYKRELEKVWDSARRWEQREYLVHPNTLSQLHDLTVAQAGRMHNVQLQPDLWLYLHAPLDEDPYLILITYAKPQVDDVVLDSINLDRCVFTDADGNVDRGGHMQDENMPEHPNGPQTFNADHLIGLEEAGFWQERCQQIINIIP